MELGKLSDEEIVAIADPIMDNLMQGSTEIDHAKHTRDFSQRLKNIVTKEHLEKVCKKYQSEWGCFAERELIRVLRRRSSVLIAWKQKCTRTDDEFLAEVVLVQEGSRYLVDHVFVL